MKLLKLLGMAYAAIAYVGFFVVFGLLVLRTMGYCEQWGLGAGVHFDSLAQTLLFDLVLLVLFAGQHTVMARPRFKRWLTRVVPTSLERSTFVAASNLALGGLTWYWASVPGTVWQVEFAPLAWALWGLGVAGWLGVAASSFLIDHFELFGLRQAWRALRGTPSALQPFKTPGAYRSVRHPMMLAMLVGLWATPEMDVVRLVLAVGLSVYILIGVQFEERDLVAHFGDEYRQYTRRVPQLIPGLAARPKVSGARAHEASAMGEV